MNRIRPIIAFLCLLVFIVVALNAEVAVFTAEELSYIQELGPIPTVIIDGAAPLSFLDDDGNIQGIGKAVMDHITSVTGLHFEYTVASSTDEYFSSDVLLGVGVTPPYVPSWVITSTPYLKSETIIVAHEDFDPARIGSYTFASLQSGTIPQGVDEKQMRYYNTREQTLDAVERGEVDFTYGNAFSVAYYSLRNGYKNILMVPQKMEERIYSVGLFKEDPLLLSVINKAIESIDETKMQTLILGVAANVDQKLTVARVFREYTAAIATSVLAVLAMLLSSVIFTVRANRRYQALAELSNEFLFEYRPIRDILVCSSRCRGLFSSEAYARNGMDAIKALITSTKGAPLKDHLTLPIDDETEKTFAVLLYTKSSSIIPNRLIIGKLIDVSDQIDEKKQLLRQLEVDGLTGLYNAQATKKRIKNRLSSKEDDVVDALFLLDVDSFKAINDTYGHLAGDSVLQHVANELQRQFRTSDTVGRIGGDEFCVYLHEIPEDEYLLEKANLLGRHLSKPCDSIAISVSFGIATTREDDSFETLFKRADEALYQAKASQKPFEIK